MQILKRINTKPSFLPHSANLFADYNRIAYSLSGWNLLQEIFVSNAIYFSNRYGSKRALLLWLISIFIFFAFLQFPFCLDHLNEFMMSHFVVRARRIERGCLEDIGGVYRVFRKFYIETKKKEACIEECYRENEHDSS